MQVVFEAVAAQHLDGGGKVDFGRGAAAAHLRGDRLGRDGVFQELREQRQVVDDGLHKLRGRRRRVAAKAAGRLPPPRRRRDVLWRRAVGLAMRRGAQSAGPDFLRPDLSAAL